MLEDSNAADQETPTDRIIAKQDAVSISQSTDIAMDKLCVYIQAFNGLFLLTISPLKNPRETLHNGLIILNYQNYNIVYNFSFNKMF